MNILERVNGRKRVISGIDFNPITNKEELGAVIDSLLTQLNFKRVGTDYEWSDGREEKTLSFKSELSTNMGKDVAGYTVIESFDLCLFLVCKETRENHSFLLTLHTKEENNWNSKLREFCVEVVTETREAYQRLGFI